MTHRITTGLATVFASAVFAQSPNVENTDDLQISVGDEIELTPAELDQITAQVLTQNPLLSSSPGIKATWAQRSVRSIDIADVIYHPHTETAGLKQAFQVKCRRHLSVDTWTCGKAAIRAYLRLDTQDFEVRVRGGIGSDVALALIAATRQVAAMSAADGSATPETAVMIWPERDRILVSWGSPEGYQDVVVEARLKQGGDPADANDWQADTYSPSY